MSLIHKIRDNVTCDQVSKQKDGTIMFRRGYFYRHGMTPEQFRDQIVAQLKSAGFQFDVLDCGDHWTTFNGSASLAKSSHFYVRVEIFG